MDANREDEINDLNEEIITDLKVKADPQDITPDERKRSVKKLAGAISHSLRSRGEINVRAFGAAAIGKATKALSIARTYINAQNLQLECSPAFITAKMGENELTGISFVTFANEKNSGVKEVDIEAVKMVLRVQADPEDVTPEERKRNVKKLAGSIAHSLEDNKEVVVRCFGNACYSKVSKSLAVSRGYTAVRGVDMYCYPYFIVADMNGNERTGIAWYVHTNETN